MGHGKLRKFAEMETFRNVVQSSSESLRRGQYDADSNPSPMQMRWTDFFEELKDAAPPRSDSAGEASCPTPLVLELGCGRGEYTIGLARRFPEKNFVGVDIKGARMWHGAKQALAEHINNAAFLRTNIEFIDHFFCEDEVSEIWLTFSDPQMKKPTKRLTSSYFLQRYRKILCDKGIIHLKTDSNFLFRYTLEVLKANGIEPELKIDDVYGNDSEAVLREVQTYYEQMWLERGIAIKYLRFRLPHEGELVEPNVEIPFDEYRSYNRHKRSTRDAGI